MVQLEEFNNGAPTEVEVDLAVRGMKGGRKGGPSGMRKEYLKGCRKEAKREKEPEGRMWELKVRLVQVMFRDRTVTEDISWAKMVLTPKRKGG